MSNEVRLVFVILSSIAVGAAVATAVLLGTFHHNPMGHVLGPIPLLVWISPLLYFARGPDPKNPSELIWRVLVAAGASCLVASDLVGSGNFDWLSGISVVLILAVPVFKLRAITVKYANKRKAQSA